MKTLGSELIVHDKTGGTFIVRGEDEEYSVQRCTLVEVGRYRRKWQAVDAVALIPADADAGRTPDAAAARRRDIAAGLAERLATLQQSTFGHDSRRVEPGAVDRAFFKVVVDELAAAGITLDSSEARLVEWLCRWEPTTIASLVSLMLASAWGGAS